jgi:hypothetical protein
MSGPPLSGQSSAQAAGSSVTGSSRPQALIQRRQRLTYELQLSTLVILSRPALQPAAGDAAVAQPTMTPLTRLVRAPEPIGDMPPRHIPRPTSLRALRYVPSGVVVRAWLPEPCPAATGGSGFTIETGSESAIGISWELPHHFRQGKGKKGQARPRRDVARSKRRWSLARSGNPLVWASRSDPKLLRTNGLHTRAHPSSGQRQAVQCLSASAFSKKNG